MNDRYHLHSDFFDVKSDLNNKFLDLYCKLDYNIRFDLHMDFHKKVEELRSLCERLNSLKSSKSKVLIRNRLKQINDKIVDIEQYILLESLKY